MTALSGKRYVAPGLIALLLGLALVLQVRTQARKTELLIQESRVPETLVSQMVQVSKERERLIAELRVLRDALSREQGAARLQDELELERTAAGTQGLTGPGVVVTLGAGARGGAQPPSAAVDRVDVLRVLNELRAGGADGIAINGVRVTDRLSIAQVGTGGARRMLLDGRPLEAPVVIEAVGDPAVLSASLNLRGGILQEIQQWYPVSLQASQHLELPAAPLPVLRQARAVR